MAEESPRSAASPRPRVLLVDDKPAQLRSLRHQLELEGYEGLEASDPTSLMAQLVHDPEFVLLDQEQGVDLIGRIRARCPATRVIVLTRAASVDCAVACMRAGAFDYVEQPPGDRSRVIRTLERARYRRAAHGDPVRISGIVARSEAMQDVLRLVLGLVRNQSNVLIQAESGTGKELIARAIHAHSPCRNGPFVPVDCGALPEGIVEGELFGFERGAFTGAVHASAGLFRSADGGTLFLDEIGELPIHVQAKLLRALQSREVRPLGATGAVPIDVRIIAATNRDLGEEVRAGRFRADLYYRLWVVVVPLPALRERPDDIPALVEEFLERARRRGARIGGIDPDALEVLRAGDWPGNVRELENTIEAAVALAPGPMLTRADLFPRGQVARPAPAPEGIPLTLSAYERACLEETLLRVDGDVRAAAKLLGIGRSTLYRKLVQHGIERGGLSSEGDRRRR